MTTITKWNLVIEAVSTKYCFKKPSDLVHLRRNREASKMHPLRFVSKYFIFLSS